MTRQQIWGQRTVMIVAVFVAWSFFVIAFPDIALAAEPPIPGDPDYAGAEPVTSPIVRGGAIVLAIVQAISALVLIVALVAALGKDEGRAARGVSWAKRAGLVLLVSSFFNFFVVGALDILGSAIDG